MAIDVEWQDESGRAIARYNGPEIDQKVWSRFPSSGACLRFIDPYGDTVFNQAQIKVLTDELDAILIAGPGTTPGTALVAVREFIRGTVGTVHTYLKFIGD